MPFYVKDSHPHGPVKHTYGTTRQDPATAPTAHAASKARAQLSAAAGGSAGAAQRAPLGMHETSAAPGAPAGGCGGLPPVEALARRGRYAARDRLRGACLGKSVRMCGSAVGGGVVQVRAGDHAGLAGVYRCGNGKLCPVCAAKIQGARAEATGRAVAYAQTRGLLMFFATFTVQHGPEARLADMYDLLAGAWRGTFGNTPWKDRKAHGTRNAQVGVATRLGVLGWQRVVEATYGKPWQGGNGWHLHYHVMLYVDPGLVQGVPAAVRGATANAEWLLQEYVAAELRTYLAGRWVQQVTKRGGRALAEHAVDVRPVQDGGAEYVAQYLNKATYGQDAGLLLAQYRERFAAKDAAAGIGRELNPSPQRKSARKGSGVTPFELLAELQAQAKVATWRLPKGLGRNGFQDRAVNSAATILPPLTERSGPRVVVETEDGPLEIRSKAHSVLLEWEHAGRGRPQTTWQHKHKGANLTAAQRLWNEILWAAADDATDEELVDTEDGDAEDAVVSVPAPDWNRCIHKYSARAPMLLEAAERGDVAGLCEMLRDFGCDYTTGPAAARVSRAQLREEQAAYARHELRRLLH